jgi:flagellar basal body rod protein FlgC
MDLFQSMEISASGLNAQRGVLNAISMNLANANSTRTEEGGPYIRRRAVLSPVALPTRFPPDLDGKNGSGIAGRLGRNRSGRNERP